MFLLLRSVVSSLFWCRLVPISWSPHPAWEVGEAGSAGVGRERVGARETCPKLVVGGKGRVSEPCPDVDWLAACLGCRALFTLPCRAPAGVVAPCLRVFRRRFDRGIHWGGLWPPGVWTRRGSAVVGTLDAACLWLTVVQDFFSMWCVALPLWSRQPCFLLFCFVFQSVAWFTEQQCSGLPLAGFGLGFQAWPNEQYFVY